jgi:hypothetical protein
MVIRVTDIDYIWVVWTMLQKTTSLYIKTNVMEAEKQFVTSEIYRQVTCQNEKKEVSFNAQNWVVQNNQDVKGFDVKKNKIINKVKKNPERISVCCHGRNLKIA